MIVNHAKWVQKPEPTQSSQQRRSGSDSRRSMGPTLTGGNIQTKHILTPYFPANPSTTPCLCWHTCCAKFDVPPTCSVLFGLPAMTMMYTRNRFFMNSHSSWIPAFRRNDDVISNDDVTGMTFSQVYFNFVRQVAGTLLPEEPVFLFWAVRGK